MGSSSSLPAATATSSATLDSKPLPVSIAPHKFNVDIEFKNMPGVFTNEDCEQHIVGAIQSSDRKDDPWLGSLNSMINHTMPSRFKDAFQARDENAPSPEEIPYTFWERIGAMPVHVARIRPREYYYPWTDFRNFTYDESSDEEVQLRAAWLSKMFDISWHWPAIWFASGFCLVIPLPPAYRTPSVVAIALTSVFLEGARVYVNAAPEREKLDDFIVAKEFWYVKNVEALELGLVAKTSLTKEEKEKRREAKLKLEAEEIKQMAMYQMPDPAQARQFAAAVDQFREHESERKEMWEKKVPTSQLPIPSSLAGTFGPATPDQVQAVKARQSSPDILVGPQFGPERK